MLETGDGNSIAAGGTYGIILSDGTNAERILSTPFYSGYQAVLKTGNTNVAVLDAGTPSTSGRNKVALAFAKNDFALSLNGSDAVTDTSGAVPVVNQMHIGSRNSADSFLETTVRSVQYYNKRLSDAQLKNLSSM